MEGVDNQLEIVFVQELPGITTHFGSDHATWHRVVRFDADIERVFVVHQMHDGSLSGGVTFLWLLLDEVVDDGGACPLGGVQLPVEPRRRSGSPGFDVEAFVRGLRTGGSRHLRRLRHVRLTVGLGRRSAGGKTDHRKGERSGSTCRRHSPFTSHN